MTRLFTDGAERNDILFWTSGNPAVIAGGVTSYAYRCDDNPTKSFTAIAEGYFRERFKFQGGEYGWGGYEAWMPRFSSGGNEVFRITQQDNTHYICAKMAGEAVIVGTAVILTNVWYLIEVYFKIDDTVGRIVVKVDGIIAIDFTGDTLTGALTTIDTLRIGNGSYGAGYSQVDDLALNDTSNADGKGDNSWCGSGYVVRLDPNADGVTNAWMGSDADQEDNYLLVDEYPNNGDTDYVSTDSEVPGTQEQYGMSTVDLAGKIIKRVWAEATAKKSGEATAVLKVGILPPGGTDQLSSGATLGTGYIRVIGNEYILNPVDDEPFGAADIDDIEFVAEVG
jgi:hypothetical protein